MMSGKGFYHRWGKRSFDILVTIPSLIVLSPVMAIIALLVMVQISRSVIFRQKRPGLNGKPFTLYKFRTMTEDRDNQGNLLPDEDRLTVLGEFLRKTSLDELPELWNALKGDMSLVGPRPLLVSYLDRYTPEQARRHDVKPGITGWAQVNGRNAITWEDKFRYDVWYVDNQNFRLDVKIIFVTVLKVMKGEGINQPGQATMEEFKGREDVR